MDSQKVSVIYEIMWNFYSQVGIYLLPVFLLGLIILTLMAFHNYRYFKRIKNSGIYQIDQMTGWEFEKFLEGLFIKLGYRVNLVGSNSGDYGGDLVIEKDGIKTLVQAKRYKKNVGIAAVQEVVAGKAKYSCQRTMVVTNSYFTRQAWHLAKLNYVKLWSRQELIRQILRSKS